MKLTSIIKQDGVLVLAAGALIGASVLGACSSPSSQTPAASAPAAAAAAMPQSANFIADMPTGNSSTMTTMAITVEGDKVVAYATNGINDDAYFLGTQKGGQLDLMSIYADHLTASFDGTKIDGVLAMNENNSTPVRFAASRVENPAGIYTAAEGGSRATWVVRPDSSTVGVMDNSAPGDHKVTDAIDTKNKKFMDGVRQMRLNRQMQQAPTLAVGSLTMTMGGATVTAVPVTGGMPL